MQMSDGLADFFYDRDFTPKSRVWYDEQLRAFLAWLAVQSVTTFEQLTAAHVRRYLVELRTQPSKATGKPLAGYTVHGHARAIKSFLNWAAKDGLVAENLPHRIEMPKREQKVIAVLTPQQIAALFRACERPGDTQYGWLASRDTAILAVLLDTGIRAAELCDLACDRVRFDRDDAYLIVNGKGRKQREVGLGVRSRRLLHRYLTRARPVTALPHVFVGRDPRRPLTPDGLGALLARLKEKAGVRGVRCSPHDFRHTFAYTYMAAGGDVLRLSRLLGHTDLAVTQGYLRAFAARDARRGSPSVLDGLGSSA